MLAKYSCFHSVYAPSNSQHYQESKLKTHTVVLENMWKLLKCDSLENTIDYWNSHMFEQTMGRDEL